MMKKVKKLCRKIEIYFLFLCVSLPVPAGQRLRCRPVRGRRQRASCRTAGRIRQAPIAVRKRTRQSWQSWNLRNMRVMGEELTLEFRSFFVDTPLAAVHTLFIKMKAYPTASYPKSSLQRQSQRTWLHDTIREQWTKTRWMNKKMRRKKQIKEPL